MLNPYQSLLYTWDDPCKERTLLWNVYNNKGKDFCVPFWKDGFGEEKVSFHVVRKGQSLPNDNNNKHASKSMERDNSSSSDDSEGEIAQSEV